MQLLRKWFHEQGTLTHIWNVDEEVRKRLVILPDELSPHFYNTMTWLMRGGMIWKPKDCICHIAGGPWGDKKKLVNEVMKLIQ